MIARLIWFSILDAEDVATILECTSNLIGIDSKRDFWKTFEDLYVRVIVECGGTTDIQACTAVCLACRSRLSGIAIQRCIDHFPRWISCFFVWSKICGRDVVSHSKNALLPFYLIQFGNLPIIKGSDWFPILVSKYIAQVVVSRTWVQSTPSNPIPMLAPSSSVNNSVEGNTLEADRSMASLPSRHH